MNAPHARKKMNKITVIGAGLAGCEAALHIANCGIAVDLIEMKPTAHTPAHHTDKFAELVCSNSLKAQRIESAAGLLKAEMECLGSVCMEAARKTSVAAGGALAVDRDLFSEYITNKIKSNPNITVINKTVRELPDNGICIVATGPLTEGGLSENIASVCGDGNLYFFDAAAPIISADSIDFSVAFMAARYGRGGDDYINCPMNEQEYNEFWEALCSAETVEIKEFEQKVYEGCMPIEVMAKRGKDSIRFGPLKPVGLRDPRTDKRPYAVVQLRRENTKGTLYNLVGFQTNLKFPEQKKVFSMIPGLSNAEFMRYGVMHRNTFINSPKLLDKNLSLKKKPNIFIAGQLSGVEGYMESAASGIIAAINAVRKIKGEEPYILPDYTMIGALLSYICTAPSESFQPMGANFGIILPTDEVIRDKNLRYARYAERSLAFFGK